MLTRVTIDEIAAAIRQEAAVCDRLSCRATRGSGAQHYRDGMAAAFMTVAQGLERLEEFGFERFVAEIKQ